MILPRLLPPLVLCALLATPAVAQPLPPSAGAVSLSAIETALATLPDQDGATSLALREFYAERDFQPVWFDGQGLSEQGRTLALELPEVAYANGLNPGTYTVSLPDAAFGPDAWPTTDVALTAALMRYARDVGTGLLDPQELDANFALPRRPIDLVAVAEGGLQALDLPGYLVALQPVHPEYYVLKELLRDHRMQAAQGGWIVLPAGPSLKPGMSDPRVPALRERLVASGDYESRPAGETAVSVPELYDDRLVAAVERFQKRHGLASDGVVGPRTLAALNVSASSRVDQIVANMERLRWLSPDLGRRHVLVNVAGFTLRGVVDGEVAVTMPVIVGQGKQQTPLFSDAIQYLDFNPYWYIPYSIARDEIIPTLQRDPAYAVNQGIVIYDGHGSDAPAISPYDVDWNGPDVSASRFRFQQFPGPENPLGRVKFMFPNQFSVYLHDTSSPHLFDRVVRAMSHGCVRVGDPAALADFVLAEEANWTSDRFDLLISSGITQRVRLKEPVPVHLTYQTAWREIDGTVQFRDDIYGRDAKVLRALAKLAERQVALDASTVSR